MQLANHADSRIYNFEPLRSLRKNKSLYIATAYILSATLIFGNSLGKRKITFAQLSAIDFRIILIKSVQPMRVKLSETLSFFRTMSPSVPF